MSAPVSAQANGSPAPSPPSAESSSRKPPSATAALAIRASLRPNLTPNLRPRTPPEPPTPISTPAVRSRSIPDNLSIQNGEPSQKVLRTNIGQSASSSSRDSQSTANGSNSKDTPTGRFPSLRTVGDDDVQYERVIKTLMQYEKPDPANDTPFSLPVAQTADEAAKLTGILPNELSAKEKDYFPEVAGGKINLAEHCWIRNLILQIWLKNPKRHLTEKYVTTALKEQKVTLIDHAIKVLRFLNRVCLVNYGELSLDKLPPKVPVLEQKHVVVIGAGIAGLAAARQLMHFGFKVTVLEGRNRPGGRVDTWYLPGSSKVMYADKGTMLLTGLEGNPLLPVIHGQLGMKLERLDMRCPIFENNGHHLASDRDEILEAEFTDLLKESCEYFEKFYRNYSKLDIPPAPGVGKCLQEVMRSRELAVMVASTQALKKRTQVIGDLAELYRRRTELHCRAGTLLKQYNALLVEPSSTHTDESLKRVKTKLREVKQCIQRNNREIQDKEQSPPETFSNDLKYSVYMSDADRKVITWHLANYDTANATPFDHISVDHFVKDDEEVDLPGGLINVPGGFGTLIDRLSNGVNILHNHTVTKVTYSGKQPVVTVFSIYNSAKEFPCDAVVCTLPLGVLKSNYVRFEPPLPESHCSAVRRLGFGIVNRVILVYSRKFWKTKRTMFGYVHPDPERRGEFHIFWGLYDQPVLMGLIAGKRADAIEKMDDEAVINTCTQVLQNIFGKNVVQAPKEYKITKWGSDVMSRGSYSSVPVGASGADFDQLSEPITQNGLPRICFAGEHTIRKFPGTLHGAFMSGMREATRIADAFGGVDNV